MSEGLNNASLRVRFDIGTLRAVEAIMGLRWLFTAIALVSFLNLHIIVFYSESLGTVDFRWLRANINIYDIFSAIVFLPIVFALISPVFKLILNLIRFKISTFSPLSWLVSNATQDYVREHTNMFVKGDTLKNFAITKDNDLAYKAYEEHIHTIEEVKFISRMADGTILCVLTAYLLSELSPQSLLFLPSPTSIEQLSEQIHTAFSLTYGLTMFFVFGYSCRDRSGDDYVFLPSLAKVINDEMTPEELQSESSPRHPSIPPVRPTYKSESTDA